MGRARWGFWVRARKVRKRRVRKHTAGRLAWGFWVRATCRCSHGQQLGSDHLERVVRQALLHHRRDRRLQALVDRVLGDWQCGGGRARLGVSVWVSGCVGVGCVGCAAYAVRRRGLMLGQSRGCGLSCTQNRGRARGRAHCMLRSAPSTAWRVRVKRVRMGCYAFASNV